MTPPTTQNQELQAPGICQTSPHDQLQNEVESTPQLNPGGKLNFKI